MELFDARALLVGHLSGTDVTLISLFILVKRMVSRWRWG